MMICKCVLFLLFITSAVLTAPIDESKDEITKYENVNDGSGNYKFSFETSGGMYREETGQWVDKGQPGEHLEVVGEYVYTAPDRTTYVVKYKSDQNGYQIINVEEQQAIPGVVFSAPVGPGVLASLLG